MVIAVRHVGSLNRSQRSREGIEDHAKAPTEGDEQPQIVETLMKMLRNVEESFDLRIWL